MTRRLLLLSYWFPPNNAIGASRAAAIARFFTDQGWKVTVVGADSGAVSRDFMVDLSGIDVHRVTDTSLTRFLNIKPGRKFWLRATSTLLRYGAFPDAFRTTTRKMGRVVDDLIAQGQTFDVILSTALPFSQHEVAGRIARKAGALLVLDNRDTWACSAYRRRLPFSDKRERRYEHSILSAGDILTTISDGMTQYFCRSYPDLADRFSTIRNGVDSSTITGGETGTVKGQVLRLVYTGILYGERRDIRPVLQAAQQTALPIAFDFYGSESNRVEALKQQFPGLEIVDHGRVSRHEAMAAQRNASALLVGLGTDSAEKTFLPGKFFEYVGSGRPIIVIADQGYEISRLVDEFGLGIATRNPEIIAPFLLSLAEGMVPMRQNVAEPLTRDYQLGMLENRIIAGLEVARDKHEHRGEG